MSQTIDFTVGSMMRTDANEVLEVTNEYIVEMSEDHEWIWALECRHVS